MPVDPSDVTITPVSVPSRAEPGEMVLAELDLSNTAPEIPNDEPNWCDYFGTGDRGLAVRVDATVGAGNTVDSRSICLLPGHSLPVTLEFQAPPDPGEYAMSFTVKSQPGDEPAVWDSYVQNIDIGEGGGGELSNAHLAVGALAAVGVGEYVFRRYTGD